MGSDFLNKFINKYSYIVSVFISNMLSINRYNTKTKVLGGVLIIFNMDPESKKFESGRSKNTPLDLISWDFSKQAMCTLNKPLVSYGSGQIGKESQEPLFINLVTIFSSDSFPKYDLILFVSS